MRGEIDGIAGRKTLGRSERHDKRIFPRGGDAGARARKRSDGD